MLFILSFLNTMLPVLYLLAVFMYGLHFFGTNPQIEKYLTPTLRGIIGFHGADVILRGFYYVHLPLASVFESATMIALALAAIYLVIEHRIKIKSTGFFVLIVVFLLQLFSSAFIDYVTEIPDILQNPLFIFHAGTAVLAYSAFAVAAIYGFMYLMLFHDLKGGHFGLIYNRMPPLEILDEMNHKAAKIGLLFLTLTILLGAIWSTRIEETISRLDPKIILAYITWIIYAAQIVGRRWGRWDGRRLALVSLIGFALILFSMAGVNVFFKTFHQFK